MAKRLAGALVVCVIGLVVSLGAQQVQIVVTSPDGQPVTIATLPDASKLCQIPATFPLGLTSVNCAGFQVIVMGRQLVQKENLSYLGAFRVPASNGFDYAGQGLAISARGLFLTGKSNEPGGQKTAEINRPAPSLASTIAALPVATFLQPFTEPTEGKIALANVAGTGTYIGDYLVVGERLCLVLYAYYDGGSKQSKVLVCRPSDLSVTGKVEGPVGVVSTSPLSTAANVNRFVNGYLASIPSGWQAALGGPVAIGGTPSNISGGASNGDDFFATDLATVADPQPITPGFYFPQLSPEGFWNAQSEVWNGTTGASTSCEIPDGFGSLLCVKRLGLGVFCYGNGTTDQSLDGTVNAKGVRYCYDPANGTKGDHAYPYAVRINAYRIDDLVKVRAGAKPSDVRPYASWSLDLPFSALPSGLSGRAPLIGVAYDHALQQLVLSMASDGPNNRPIVHTFQITGGMK